MPTSKPPTKRRRSKQPHAAKTSDASTQTGFSESLSALAFSSQEPSFNTSLQHLLTFASEISGVQNATLCLTVSGCTRTIASLGEVTKFRSTLRSLRPMPYGSDETIIVDDATERIDLLNMFRRSDNLKIGFFLRFPVMVAPDFFVALLLFDREPKNKPHANAMRLLTNIVGMLRDQIKDVCTELATSPLQPKFPITVPDIVEEIKQSDAFALLLDENLTPVAGSDAARALSKHGAPSILGHTYNGSAPALAGSLAFFMYRALDQGLTTPDLEVVIEQPGNGCADLWSVHASPVRPMGTSECFLYITGSILATENPLKSLHADATAMRSHPANGELTAEFLFDTLIHRRGIRVRDSVSYMSLRSWRQPLKEFQIKALKALKTEPGTQFPKRIGAEIANEMTRLLGTGAFDVVVPMSCGHSKGRQCLSVEIARSVGRSLNIPVVQAFERQRLAGSSHPKQNRSRPPLRLGTPVEGAVVLVDDVATSGLHLSEAATLLRPSCRMVLPVAWIGGDASDAD
jgi:hypothetical protein